MNVQDPVFEGVLLVDKPVGITSHDIVDRLRRKLKMKKIGHAGTLDPLATGLMIMLIGKATKISQFLISLDKIYDGEFLLGIETDSQDADGQIVAEKPVSNEITQERIETEMKGFLGDQYQTPPMFSAKKIDGVPLYKMARKGKTVQREPRFIRINELTLNSWSRPRGEFTLACSKGTYVRTVLHDLGQKLECGAHLTALRRTKIDQFEIDEAKTLEEIELMPLSDFQSLLIPIHKAVPAHVFNLMEVFTSIEDLGRSTDKPIYLALGMFDGVHMGHQSVLARVLEIARKNNGVAIAFTFPEHPGSFLRPESSPKLLMNKDEKAAQLLKTGVDGVVLRTFDYEFANVEGIHFPSFLIARLPSLQGMCVGENFRFGKGRSGDSEDLKEYGREVGLSVEVVQSELYSNSPVSSSRIRESLLAGEIKEVNQMLGRKYIVSNHVLRGKGMGKSLVSLRSIFLGHHRQDRLMGFILGRLVGEIVGKQSMQSPIMDSDRQSKKRQLSLYWKFMYWIQ